MLKNIVSIVFLLFTVPLLATLEIREPYAHEINEIAELYHNSWHDTYGIIAPHLSAIKTRENCLIQWQKYYQKSNPFFMLVALQNTKIVGVIFAGPRKNEMAQKYIRYDSEIDKLYVLPASKNQGIGSQLFKAALNKLYSLGFKATIIWSLTKNVTANKFYEKNGGILIDQPTGSFNEKMNIYGFQLS